MLALKRLNIHIHPKYVLCYLFLKFHHKMKTIAVRIKLNIYIRVIQRFVTTNYSY